MLAGPGRMQARCLPSGSRRRSPAPGPHPLSARRPPVSPAGPQRPGARLSICSGRRCDRRVTGPGRGAALLCVRAAAAPASRVRLRAPRFGRRHVHALSRRPGSHLAAPRVAHASVRLRGAQHLTPGRFQRPEAPASSAWPGAPGPLPGRAGTEPPDPARPLASGSVAGHRALGGPWGGFWGGPRGRGSVRTAAAPAPGPLRGRTVRLVARTRAA